MSAVVVLAVNDHVLKQRWPGLITGKLSDVAGVFVVAVVLSIVARRTSVGIATTAAGFIAIKLSATAAMVVAPVLGGVTLQDPSDLLALAVLPLAVRHVRTTSRWIPNRTSFWAALQQVVLALVLGVTMLTVTATSCPAWPSVAWIVEDGDGLFALIREDLETGSDVFYASNDGGRTWEATDRVMTAEPTVATEACLSDGRCVRVADNVRVQVRYGDQPWLTAFEYDEEETRRMELRESACSGRGDVDDLFASVAVVGSGDDEVALVAMATQGVLRFDPRSDEWTRHPVGSASPLSLDGPRWLAHLLWAPLIGFGVVAVTLLSLILREFRSAKRRALAAVGGGAILGLLSIVALWGFFLSVADYASFGITIGLISAIVLLVTLAVMIPQGAPPPLPPPPQMPPPPQIPRPPEMPRPPR